MQDNDRHQWLRYASAGVEFSVTFGMLLGAGFLADQYLDTLPGFTLWGFVLGFSLALYRLLRQVRAIREEIDRDRQANKRSDT